MHRFFTKRNVLDSKIADLTMALDAHDDAPEKYDIKLALLERLYKLKAQEASRRVSPDTALLVTANLVSIAAILHHEQFNVITSKAMSFVIKPK